MSLFLVADTHFDDENAINYHNRPFDDRDHMNETLVHNWNRVVSYNDTVLVVGDFTGPDVSAETTGEWSHILNGDKIFIHGNNDSLSDVALQTTKIHDDYKLHHNGHDLYCIHKPDDAPKDWNGWVVHGHAHQLHPQKYPAYSYKNKRVNVSVEQIGYTPISATAVTDMIEKISPD